MDRMTRQRLPLHVRQRANAAAQVTLTNIEIAVRMRERSLPGTPRIVSIGVRGVDRI